VEEGGGAGEGTCYDTACACELSLEKEGHEGYSPHNGPKEKQCDWDNMRRLMSSRKVPLTSLPSDIDCWLLYLFPREDSLALLADTISSGTTHHTRLSQL
jgi:hypothetical protein